MVLSESEVQEIYNLAKKANMQELNVLSNLFLGMAEGMLKEETNSIALLLDKYERGKK